MTSSRIAISRVVWTSATASLVLFSLVLLSTSAAAQPLTATKWSKSDPVAADRFGNAVALDGPLAVVGAARDNDPVTRTGQYGAAYVFRFDGSQWLEEAKLTAPERENLAWFGRAVAVDDDVVLVGIRNDELNADGAVYVFRFDGSTWIEEAKLTASDRTAGDEFGAALAVEGDVALVGAPNRGVTASQEGAVYVFRYDGGVWVEDVTLTPSDPAGNAFFGASVALSGTRALIGAWGESPPAVGQSAGAAYVFEIDGGVWTESAKLAATDTSSGAQFGISVSMDGDRALIGAPLDDELGGGAGAAYVFRYADDDWTQEAKLLASDYAGFNLFGSSVELNGAAAVVGAGNWAPPGGDGTGKAYYFEYDETLKSWQEQWGMVPADGDGGDGFGNSVALDGGVILVGSPEHDQPIGGVGAVYSYGEPVASYVEPRVSPNAPRLSAAYPNPFHERANLILTLEQPEWVQVSVFDLLGRQVRVLHEGMWSVQTSRTISMLAGGLPNGVYVIRVATSTYTVARTLMLAR